MPVAETKPRPLPRLLRPLFLIVDVGFIVYWLVTLARVIPDEYLFKDYDDPILSAWNWSFLPLDLLISASGLLTLRRARRGESWERYALLSLTLTSCSGLMAVAFWTLRSDFDPGWWAPNLFLLLYPLFYLPALIRGDEH